MPLQLAKAFQNYLFKRASGDSSHLSQEGSMGGDGSTHFRKLNILDIKIGASLFNDLADSRIMNM